MSREWGRDPLQILLARESKTCRGCGHIQVAFDRQYCGKGKKMTRRCAQYVETTITSRGNK